MTAPRPGWAPDEQALRPDLVAGYSMGALIRELCTATS